AFLITEACPRRKFDGGIGKFMPALPQEFRTTPADVNPHLGFAALFGHWSNAGVAADGRGFWEATAIGSQRGQKARSQDRSSSGQALENGCVGMGGEELGNLLVVLVEERTQRGELSSQGLKGQAMGGQQGGVCGQGHGTFDQRQALAD